MQPKFPIFGAAWGNYNVLQVGTFRNETKETEASQANLPTNRSLISSAAQLTTRKLRVVIISFNFKLI